MALLRALCRLLLFNLVIVKGYLSNSPHIITFWGQDPSIKDADNVVRALNKTCGKSSYTTVVIGFVNKSFKNKTTASLPPMHCIKSKRSKTKLSLYCPEIAKKVEQCQKNNRKVLIGVGGPNETLYFDDANSAQYFAKKIWNWFLGGTEVSEMRPFGGIKLDGVNLFLKDSGSKHLDIFLRTLDELSSAQPGVKYTYTMSVPCNNPDLYFGEGNSKLSKDKIVPLIKQIYVRYAGKPCCKDGPKHFRGELHEWKGFSADPNRPELFVLFPRNPHTTMTNCFSSPRQLSILNNMISLKNNLAEYIAETKMSYLKKAKSLIRAKHETTAGITRSTSLNKIFTQEVSGHQTSTNSNNHTNIDLKQQTEEANSKLFQLNKKIAAFRANLRNTNKDMTSLLNEYDHEKEHTNITASDIDVSNHLKGINSMLKKEHANNSVSDDDGSNHLKEVYSKQKKEHANSSAVDDETSSQLKEIQMLEKEQVRSSPSDHDALNQLKEADTSQESAPTNSSVSDNGDTNQMEAEEKNQLIKTSNKSASNHPVKIKLDLSVTLHNTGRKGEQTKDDAIHLEENKSFEQSNFDVPKPHEILLNDINEQSSDNVAGSRKKPDVEIAHKESEAAIDHGDASVEFELKDVEETKPVKQENSGGPKMHELLLNDMEEKSQRKPQKEVNHLAETVDDNDLDEQPHHNLQNENKTTSVKSNDTNESPNLSNMNSDFGIEKHAKGDEARLDEAKSPVRQHQSIVLKQKPLLLNDEYDRALYNNLHGSNDDNDESNDADDLNDNDINLAIQNSEANDIDEHLRSTKIKRKKSLHRNMNNNNISSEILISEANEIPTNESLDEKKQMKKNENDLNKDYVDSKKKHSHMTTNDIYSKEKHHNMSNDVKLLTLISQPNEIPTNESLNERKWNKKNDHLHQKSISVNETEALKPLNNNYQGFSENKENLLDEDDDSNIDLKEFGVLDEEASNTEHSVATDHNTKQNFDDQKLSTHIHEVGNGDTSGAENEADEDESSGQNGKLVNEHLKSKHDTPQVGSGASDVKSNAYNQNTKHHKEHQTLKQKYHEEEKSNSEDDNLTSKPKGKHDKEDNESIKYDDEAGNSASEHDIETFGQNNKIDKKDQKKEKSGPEEGSGASKDDTGTSAQKEQELKNYASDEENDAAEDDNETSEKHDKRIQNDKKLQQYEVLTDATENDNEKPREDSSIANKENKSKKYDNEVENVSSGDEAFKLNRKHIKKDTELKNNVHGVLGIGESKIRNDYSDRSIMQLENKQKSKELIHKVGSKNPNKNNGRFKTKLRKHIYSDNVPEKHIPINEMIVQKLVHRNRLNCNPIRQRLCDKKYNLLGINDVLLSFLGETKRKHKKSTGKEVDSKPSHITKENNKHAYRNHHKHSNKRMSKRRTANTNPYILKKGSRSDPSKPTEAYDKNAVKNRDNQSNSKLPKPQKTEKTETNGLDVKVSSIKMKELVNRTRHTSLPVAGYDKQFSQIAPQSAETSTFETKPLVNLTNYSPETSGYTKQTTNILPQSTSISATKSLVNRDVNAGTETSTFATKPLVNLTNYSPETSGYIKRATNILPQSASISATKPLVNRHVNAGKRRKTKEVTPHFTPNIDDIDIEIQPYKNVDKTDEKRKKHNVVVSSYSNKTTAHFKPAIDDIDMEFVIGTHTRK